MSAAVFAVVSSSILALSAEMPGADQAKVRTTHDALIQRRAAAMKKAKDNNQAGVHTVKPGEIKYEKRKTLGNLMDRSSILSSGGHWTLVPKEAVLHVPAAYRARVDGKRSGKLIPWSQFLVKNRGWLQTHSVNLSQARGEQTMDPKQVDVYRKSGRVIVAVCHNGPISVKPLKVPEAVADAADAK